ncbi:UNVERIFIED_CONTAM: hypothetical protein PYX00_006061 [Menopon gallinae]|uniref:AB hydrolase-1 domain-containing protein n=1 Tax=Menopon gallinae TaxID=328185 RepID=A0AAW2HU46_9NEOP
MMKIRFTAVQAVTFSTNIIVARFGSKTASIQDFVIFRSSRSGGDRFEPSKREKMPSFGRYVLSTLALFALASECAALGVVYKTGCCPKGQDVPDIAKKTGDFIEAFGYGVEIHEIVTEDGYIVTLHRVVMQSGESSHGPAVLIQHGIAGSSILWVLIQERSLPFVLARAGYDVWLLDTRGNSYSKKHLYLRSADQEYWRYSFHEQGVFDLAAATDYVRKVTGQGKIFYIGHSRGTTMAFALLSTRPEYNEKFHLLSLYAPITYIRNVANPIVKLMFSDTVLPKLKGLVNSLQARIVPGSSDSAIQFREILCNRTQTVCMDIIFSFSGYDYDLLNKTMIPIYFSHYPEGGAIQEYLHYLQIGNTDEFRQFDYGPVKNMELYGSDTPPLYDLERITAPLSLHYSDNDLLVNPHDFGHLVSQLKSVVRIIRVPFKKFSHTDFNWATEADRYVYEPTIELMNMFIH